MSRFVRDSIFGTLAVASGTLGTFLSGLIVARTLGLDGTGSYALAVWVVAVTTTMTGAALPMTMTRYLPEVASRGGDVTAFAAFVLRPALALNAVPVLAAAAYALWIMWHGAGEPGAAQSPLGDPLLCLLVGLCCTAQALGDFVKGYLRGTQRMDVVARLTTVAAVAQLATTLAGSLAFGVGGALVGYFVGALLPALPLRHFRGVRAEAGPDLRARIIRYAKFRWLSEIAAAIVFARVEVVFLQMFWGVKTVGLWTVSITLTNLAVQLPMMLTWGLLPHFSGHVARDDQRRLREDYRAGTRLLAFLVFPACFGLAAITPEILPLLFGASFAQAITVAQILVVSAAVPATAMVGSNLILAMERSDVDLYLGIVGAILSIVGGLVLIAPMGLIGAAFSRIVTQFSAVALGTWFFSSRLGLTIPFGALARLLIASLICAAAARGMLLLAHGWVGLALAMPVGAVAYALAVRALRALEDDDLRKLRTVVERLPLPMVGAARRMLWLALG